MPIEFINPNWHVILIHYPIGLLTIGLIVEIVSCFKPRGGLRAAGRWMILLGALLAVPTLTSGLYAFRDTVSREPIQMDQKWRDLATDSPWNETQWEFMSRHIWYMSVATALALVIVFLWLANPDRVRRKLYWILLPLLVITTALVGIGAWHSGEAVYRYGTAVAVTNANPPTEDVEHDKDYYAHPLQVHVVLAGLAVAASFVGMALMFRKWEKPTLVDERSADDALDSNAARRAIDPLTEDPARDRRSTAAASLGPYGEQDIALTGPPRVYPGWFYLAASALALATAFFGAWSTVGIWDDEPIERLRKQVTDPAHRRLLWHSIVGISIVALPLVLGLVVRLARRQRLVPLALTLLLLIALGLQIWFGTLILYDGYEGPIYRFEPAAASETPTPGDAAAGEAATRPAPPAPGAADSVSATSPTAATRPATTRAATTRP